MIFLTRSGNWGGAKNMADSAGKDKLSVLERLRKWWRPDPAPSPAPSKPIPAPTMTNYVRALLLLRQIDFQKLLPVVLTVPTVLFFAISGLIAWLGILCGFFIRVVRAMIGRRQ